MQIPYLVGLKIGAGSYSVDGFYKKARELQEIPEVSGIELRFKGSVYNGAAVGGLTLDQIVKICNYVNDNFAFCNLHLSEFSLARLSKCRGRETGDCIDFMSDNFNVIVGHYGEQENFFGLLADSYIRELEGTRYSKKKGYNESIREILDEDGFLPLSLQKKAHVENGVKSYNCLSVVAPQAADLNWLLTNDIGHVIISTLERNPATGLPYDSITRYVTQKYGRPAYNTKYLRELGSRATHLHIHGIIKEGNDFKDHQPLIKGITLKGVQIGIVDRLLRDAKPLTATVELNNPTRENVTKTIENFQKMFC
jgi:hypothetical protein